MVVASDPRSGTAGVSSRIALVAAALILFGTAAWFAASWIDTGTDSTCGAVVYPRMWLGSEAPRPCGGVMAVRTIVSAVIVAAGAGALYLAARAPHLGAARATTILIFAATASGAILIINELVRSGGAFST